MANRYFDSLNERTLPLPDFKRKLDVECVKVFDSKIDLQDLPMLRGMKGYQLTPEDMEFLKTMLEEKMVAKLKKQLEEVHSLLQLETTALAEVFANRQVQEVLEKLPHWVKLVLGSTSAQVDALDAEALLGLVSSQKVSRVIQRKRVQLQHMREELEKKRRKMAEEEMQLQKVFVREQVKVQMLMTELSDLKSQLAQQEQAYESLQTNNQVSTRIKREKATVAEEKQQDYHYRLRSRRKVREKPDSVTEPTQDVKRVVVRRPSVAKQSGAKDKERIPVEALTASSTSQSAAVKPARVPQEEERVTARLSKKNKTVTATLQPGGAKESQEACLRSSKRIAKRK